MHSEHTIRCLLAAALLLAATSAIAAEQPPAVEAVDVYERMYRFLESGDFDKMRRSLDFIGDAAERIEKRYKEPVRGRLAAALDARDKPAVTRALGAFVYHDVRLSLDDCREAAREPRKALTKLKRAALTYEILSPHLPDAAAPDDEAIKSRFRKAHALLKNSSPYVDPIPLAAGIEALLSEIETRAAAAVAGLPRGGR